MLILIIVGLVLFILLTIKADGFALKAIGAILSVVFGVWLFMTIIGVFIILDNIEILYSV